MKTMHLLAIKSAAQFLTFLGITLPEDNFWRHPTTKYAKEPEGNC